MHDDTPRRAYRGAGTVGASAARRIAFGRKTVLRRIPAICALAAPCADASTCFNVAPHGNRALVP